MIFSTLFLQVMLSAVPQTKTVRITTEKKECHLDYVLPEKIFQSNELLQPTVTEGFLTYYMLQGDALTLFTIRFHDGDFLLYKKMLEESAEGESINFVGRTSKNIDIYEEHDIKSIDSHFYGRLSSSASVVLFGFSEVEAKRIIESVVCQTQAGTDTP